MTWTSIPLGNLLPMQHKVSTPANEMATWMLLASSAALAAGPAVSFAPGLLAPAGVSAARAALDALRQAGVAHLAAVPTIDQAIEPMPGLELTMPDGEVVEADLLSLGSLDALLDVTPTGEPTASAEIVEAVACDRWVHVCTSLPE